MFCFLPVLKYKLDEKLFTDRKTYREVIMSFFSRGRYLFHVPPGITVSEDEYIMVASVSHATISFSPGELLPSTGMVTSSFS
jgi:hypothetical protein